jgi:dTDP-L-rhamnose 4-epimerase
LTPLPTPEDTPLACNSIYALNKRDHEDYFLVTGKSFTIPTVALRYFNVYGTRQSLSNPYTGVAAIFISRLKAGRNPVIYEDGDQSRDFVAVEDIVEANIRAMNDARANYEVFNVGSGQPITINDLAKLIIRLSGFSAQVEITNQYRKGDIRHCFGDLSKIENTIGWKPMVNREAGLRALLTWSETAESKDTFEEAARILHQKGVL